jgi:hypothetical protein
VASIIDTEDSAPGSTSPAGARGLGQVLPNYVAPGEDPFDPETSIRQTIRAIQDKRNILQQQGYDATPEQVAGRYFGNGVDAGGMTTAGYQQRFREKYGNYSVVNGPPIPVTSGEGQVTIQHNATGQQYQITESQWRDMQSVDGNAADFTVVQQAAKPGADLRSQLTQPPDTTGYAIKNQFDLGLPLPQAQAACGPAAVALFIEATGRTPNAQEVVRIAAANGWKPSTGMGGVGAFKQTLSDEGVHFATLDPTGEAAAQSVQGGNLTAISTGGAPGVPYSAGHYFVAQGFDPTTGKFDLGKTGGGPGGALADPRASRFMTAAEIQALAGPINGVIKLVTDAGAAFKTLGDDATSAGTVTTDAFGNVTTTVTDDLGAVTTTVTDSTGNITDQFTTMSTEVPKATDGMTGAVDASFTDLGSTIQTSILDTSGNLITTVSDLSGQVVDQFGTMADGTTIAMGDMNDGTTTQVTALSTGVETTVSDLSGSTITTFTDMNGKVVGQMTVMADGAVTKTGEMAEGVGTTVKDMNGDVTDTFTDLLGNVTTTTTKIDGTVTTSFKDTAGNVRDITKDIDGTVTDTFTNINGEVTSQVKTMDGTVTTAFKAMDGTVTETIKKTDGTVTTTVKDMSGRVVSQVKTMASEANKEIEKTGDVKISAPDTSAVEKSLSKIIKQAHDAAGAVQGIGGHKSGDGGGKDPFAKGKATGGPVSKAQLYTVGEAGVEGFVPWTDGTIITHGDLVGLSKPFAAAGGLDMREMGDQAMSSNVTIDLRGAQVYDGVRFQDRLVSALSQADRRGRLRFLRGPA